MRRRVKTHNYALNVIQQLSSQRGQKPRGEEVLDRAREERDFVDEEILKVGRKEGSSIVYRNSFTPGLTVGDFYFCSTFDAISVPEDRVDFVGRHYTGVTKLPKKLKKYRKDAKVSGRLRDRGNELFKLKNFQDALHYYNLAALFAPWDSEAMGIAYANRSAVLVQLGHFQEAIQAIQLALANKYPQSSICKLEKRREECLEIIEKKHEEYMAMDPKVRNKMEDELMAMKTMRDGFFRVEKINPLIPSAAEFLEITFDKMQGRQLVVNRDVPPGTVLLVEDPYVATLDSQHGWKTDHCHQCFKRISRGIPCENCVFAIYCDESCQTEAQRIHKFECPCLPVFHIIQATDGMLQAVRIIAKVGPQELFRLFQSKDPAYFDPKQEFPFGTEPNCTYDSDSYLAVFNLLTNAEKLPFKKRFSNVHYALMAADIVESETRFFDDIPNPSRKAEFKKFVTALMLRHIDAWDINAEVANEFEGFENLSFQDIYTRKFSTDGPEDPPNLITTLNSVSNCTGIYPLFSLINHSCNPNAFRLSRTTNGTLAVLSNRTLKKGEPLLIGYCVHFYHNEIYDRQMELTDDYYFKCRCVACKERWPLQCELLKRPTSFCCPSCSKNFYENDKSSRNEFKKCVLTAPSWKCGTCGKCYDETELRHRFNVHRNLIKKVNCFLYLNQAMKALDLMFKVFDYFQYHLSPPYGHFYGLQDMLELSMESIVHLTR